MSLARFAGAVAAGLLCAAAVTPAHALDGPDSRSAGTVRLTPAEAAPGDEVGLRVDGCAGESGRAVSSAFVADAELAPAADGSGGLRARTTVRSGTEPGAYPVVVMCGPGDSGTDGRAESRTGDPRADDSRMGGSLSDDSPAGGFPSHGSPSQGAPAEDTRAEGTLTVGPPTGSPTAPVRAGGGGTAGDRTTTAAGDEGPNTRQVVVGAGLTGGAVLAMAGLALRRRRSAAARPAPADR